MAYIDTLLKKFGMEQANPVSTLLDPNVNLDNFANEGGVADKRVTASYATLIGLLMYLSIRTQLDIAFAVNKLAQFSSKPQSIHWTTIKHIFRYLKRNTYLCFNL